MASALLELALSPFRPNLTRSASSESAVSTLSGKTSSHARYSNSSTPPTSAADSESVGSAAAKNEITNDLGADVNIHSSAEVGTVASSTARSRRSRTSVADSYNLKILSSAAVHAPGNFQTTSSTERSISTRRRTVPEDSLVDILTGTNGLKKKIPSETEKTTGDHVEDQYLGSPAKTLPKRRSRVIHEVADSPRKRKAISRDNERSFKRATRSTGAPVEDLTTKLSVLSKRGRNKFEAGLVKAKRELKRLADTNEFAKIDTQPVLAEVWSNGKLVTGEERAPKRIKVEKMARMKLEEKTVVEKMKPRKRGSKVWLNKGLYAGQEVRNSDWFAGFNKEERKKMAHMLEFKPNGLLPLPMWHGQRLLDIGRNFKLPFDICSPLPPGQPKPDEWRKVPKNRFVGDAAAAWKKSTVFDDFSSRCVCSQLNGCDESCQNRIMLYECDDGNCSAGREHCMNRAFADLQERRSKGGKYRIGVEVIKTSDRGYGVRSNRCFEAHQIIVEYTGEIITEEECDRRMNEDYKDNECYYLMLFDQNMIIDATRGSIARFVNHSCEPNCRMVKWIVAGKPRMALFAGDRPIMTGEELTYDYNFDPFSAKNVQQCRCGSENCRGILGPRPKDKPKTLGSLGESLKGAPKLGKRKLEDLLVGEKHVEKSPKKRKITAPIRGPASKKAMSVAKVLKRSISDTVILKGKSGTSKKSIAVEKKLAKSAPGKKTWSSKASRVTKQAYLSSRDSTLRLVNNIPGRAKGSGNAIGKKMGTRKNMNEIDATVKLLRGIKKQKLSSKGGETKGTRNATRVFGGKRV